MIILHQQPQYESSPASCASLLSPRRSPSYIHSPRSHQECPSGYNLMEAMRSYLDEPLEEVPELTFDNMAGIYDSFNEEGSNESRIGLMKDGTATWNMIGSLHFTEYTYTISGNTICLKAKGVDSEEDCYEYDPDTRTLKNEQGAVYYRQVVE